MAQLFRRMGPLLSLALLSCAFGDDVPSARVHQAIRDGQHEAGHAAVVSFVRYDAALTGVETTCTAVLISDQLALTAAHCVGEMTGSGAACEGSKAASLSKAIDAVRTRLYLDEILVAEPDEVAQDYREIETITVHATGVPLCGNDLALLELKEPVMTIEPAAVRLTRALDVDEPLTVVGYGTDGSASDDLRRRTRNDVKVTDVGETYDGDALLSTSTEWIIDAGPCKGDSGSPAFDRDGRIVGIMSRGAPRKCTNMVYSRVDEDGGLGAWIREQVTLASQRLGAPLPEWAAAPKEVAKADDEPAEDTTRAEGGCQASSRSSSWLVLLSLLLVAGRRRGQKSVDQSGSSSAHATMTAMDSNEAPRTSTF